MQADLCSSKVNGIVRSNRERNGVGQAEGGSRERPTGQMNNSKETESGLERNQREQEIEERERVTEHSEDGLSLSCREVEGIPAYNRKQTFTPQPREKAQATGNQSHL